MASSERAIKAGWIKMIEQGITLDDQAFAAFAAAAGERIEERIAIMHDGRTDRQRSINYEKDGMHPAHARNKVAKENRIIKEQVLQVILQEIL